MVLRPRDAEIEPSGDVWQAGMNARFIRAVQNRISIKCDKTYSVLGLGLRL